MDIEATLNSLVDYLPNIIAALAVLIVGFIIALIVAAVIRKALEKTKWDDRLADKLRGRDGAQRTDVAGWIGRAAFWLIMIFVFLGALQALGLGTVANPINEFLNEVLRFLPNLIAALVLALVAWLVATVVRVILRHALHAAGLDQRLAGETDQDTGAGEPGGLRSEPGDLRSEPAARESRVEVSDPIAEIAFWLVIFLFLPAILGALGLEGLLEPVRDMTQEFLAFLPNLLAAAVILIIGWFVAKLVRDIVETVLRSAGLDRLSERVHLSGMLGKGGLSGLIGLVVFIAILIPVVIAALNALQLEAVTQPASAMLNNILLALPDIFAALLLLGISYAVGKLVAGLAASFLAGVGFNRLVARVGGPTEVPAGEGPAREGTTPSQVVGNLILIAIMLFATVEAFRLLEFGRIADIVAQFIVFAAEILFGLIIFALGVWLANLAARSIRASGVSEAGLLASVAKAAILVLAGAIALREMGIANEIINIAFALLLGAMAVAVALAFGLGARDTAGRLAKDWVGRVRGGGAGGSAGTSQGGSPVPGPASSRGPEA